MQIEYPLVRKGSHVCCTCGNTGYDTGFICLSHADQKFVREHLDVCPLQREKLEKERKDCAKEIQRRNSWPGWGNHPGN